MKSLRVDKELSNIDSWRKLDEEDEAVLQPRFKISVVSELESEKPLAQIAREHGIHSSLPS